MRIQLTKLPRLLLATLLAVCSVGTFVAPAAFALETKVVNGETLMDVARRTRESPTTTPEQQALAILKLNPRAFAKRNVYGLRRGSNLQLPNQEQAEAIDSIEAQMTIHDHGVQWNPTVAVKKGENLMDIAAQTRESDSTTVDQQALAFVVINPDAFSRGNVNGLFWGRELTIPSTREAQAIDSKTAASIIREQNLNWHKVQQKSKPASQSEAGEEQVAELPTVEIIRGSQIESTRVRHGS